MEPCKRAVSSRPIAVAAFMMFRHKEDDRACDAASLAPTIHSDVKYVRDCKAAYCTKALSMREMLQETRYQVYVDMSQFLIKIIVPALFD